MAAAAPRAYRLFHFNIAAKIAETGDIAKVIEEDVLRRPWSDGHEALTRSLFFYQHEMRNAIFRTV